MNHKAHRGAMLLIACALAFGFSWFDLPGHGSSFLPQASAMGTTYADGHTLYLLGMFVALLLTMAWPRWFERHLTTTLCTCWLAGTAALVAFSTSTPLWVSAVAIPVTGFSNVLFLNVVIGLMLTRLSDRAQRMLVITCALAAKTLIVYASDRYLNPTLQTVLLVSVPTLCVACALGAWRVMPNSIRTEAIGPIKLQPSLSPLMLGMLLVASVVFAVARVVSPLGFWGTTYPLSTWGFLPVCALSAVYLALCYFSLIKTSSQLLFRFLPALFILFGLYMTLYSSLAQQLGLSENVILVLRQYAELYSQTFVWAVALLAIRKLSIPPVRILGILFSVFTVVELALQRVLLAHSDLSLVVILLSFFVIFGVLVWTLCHFYGEKEPESAEGNTVAGASSYAPARPTDSGTVAQAAIGTPASAPTATPTDTRCALAAEHGLSARETDVFLLLSQGRSRKFICDELFIADGTASTYISRVYEKMGVHSKQELLSLVLEREKGR